MKNAEERVLLERKREKRVLLKEEGKRERERGEREKEGWVGGRGGKAAASSSRCKGEIVRG